MVLWTKLAVLGWIWPSHTQQFQKFPLGGDIQAVRDLTFFSEKTKSRFPSSHLEKSGVGAHTCRPSSREAETGRLCVRGQHELHMVRPCLKTNKRKTRSYNSNVCHERLYATLSTQKSDRLLGSLGIVTVSYIITALIKCLAYSISTPSL